MNIKIEQIEILGNRILIKPDPAKTHEIISANTGLITATGKQITASETGRMDKMEDIEPPTGVIVLAGEDCKKLAVGDRVLFSPFSGKKLTFMLEEYLMMSEPEPVMKIIK